MRQTSYESAPAKEMQKKIMGQKKKCSLHLSIPSGWVGGGVGGVWVCVCVCVCGGGGGATIYTAQKANASNENWALG